MRLTFRNGRVLSGEVLSPATVTVADGMIEALHAPDAQIGADHTVDLQGGLLVPGFVDVQVNGGGGALFGESPSVETLRTMASAHARFGTTGFLPTIISGSLDAIAAAIAATDAAIEAGVPGVLGIHIEGPFLNHGRKGIHDASQFRDLDAHAFKLLTSARHGKTLVTLAPEMTNLSTIRALAEAGVVVSAGHSDATYAETVAALESGVKGFTHLFNAMSPLTTREPGVVGAALEDRESWCSIIADGRHVAPAVMRIALRCKGPARLMLVTDAMPSVGSAEKSFLLQGQRITVKDGVCLAADGTLAGSDLDMAGAVRNAMTYLGLSLPAAAKLATHNPATFLGLGERIGRIAPGYRADLVLADDDLTVLRCWIAGCPMSM